MKNELLVSPFSLGALSEDVRLERILGGKIEQKDVTLYYFNVLLQSGIKRFVFFKHSKNEISKYNLPNYIKNRFCFKSEKKLRDYYYELLQLFYAYRKKENANLKEIRSSIFNLSYFLVASEMNHSLLTMKDILFSGRYSKFIKNNFDEKLIIPLEIMSKNLEYPKKPCVTISHTYDDFDTIKNIITSLKYENYCREHNKLKKSDFNVNDIFSRIKKKSIALREKHPKLEIKKITVNMLDWANSKILGNLEPISSNVVSKITKTLEKNQEDKKRLVCYYHNDIITRDFIRDRISEYVGTSLKQKIK